MDQPLKQSLSNRYFFAPGKKASDDYDQFWIRYKPGRVLRKNLRTWAQVEKWINLGLAVVLVYLYLVHGSSTTIGIFTLFIGLTLLTRVHYLLCPTHIVLSKDGLQLHWLHSWCNFSSALIGWDRLSHVGIARIKHFLGNEQTALDFNVVARGMSDSQRLAFRLLAPEFTSGWFSGDRCKLTFKLDGIASSDDRKRLQLALKKFLPSYRIEPAVSDELQLSIKVESYTDLWLDALSSSPKRIREESLAPGTRIQKGQYEIVRELATGGQAVIYEAIDTKVLAEHDDPIKRVVLKEFVLPAHAGLKVRKRVLTNIQREADLLKKLKHPNIVRLLEFFVEDQRAYVVLEPITGLTLKRLVAADGAMAEPAVVNFALQMCEILAYLHTQKPPVVHRDFTPDNLMIAHGDILKLIDFNVAQQLEADSVKTVVGKHAYIPPEQFRGKAGTQSDIYSMGATLYFLLTAEEPLAISVLKPKEHNPCVSDALNELVAKATAIELKDRFFDIGQMRSVLQSLKDEHDQN